MLDFIPQRLLKIDLKPFGIKDSNFFIYLDYLNHNFISGNKLRKLHENINQAKKNNHKTILTIGGNYSNHLFAAAHIPEIYGLDVVAIVKGHEPKTYGFTLLKLQEKNIPIHFVPFQALKEDLAAVIEPLLSFYPQSVFIPEGGTNEWSKYGYEPLIVDHFDWADMICVPVGTGGSLAAIDYYTSPKTKTKGYCAVNDYSLRAQYPTLDVTFEYTFGGYGKWNDVLIEFINRFKSITDIPLEQIYTGKMLYGIIEDYKKGVYKPDEQIVAIHTGGLQGLEGLK